MGLLALLAPSHIETVAVWFFVWPADLAFNSKGYKIVADHDASSAPLFNAHWKEPGIAGMVFSGHGVKAQGNWFSVLSSPTTGAISSPGSVNPPYKLAVIMAYTCGGFEANWRKHLSSNNGVFVGFWGEVSGLDVMTGHGIAVVVKKPNGEDVDKQ